MRRLLFIFAKLNPGIRYVQGMNEVVAPLLYVFANDLDPDTAVSYATPLCHFLPPPLPPSATFCHPLPPIATFCHLLPPIGAFFRMGTHRLPPRTPTLVPEERGRER